MTRVQNTACRFRHIILVFGILLTIAGIVWAFAPVVGIEAAGLLGTVLAFSTGSKLIYGINVVIVLGLLLLAQWAFLRPSKDWTVRMTTEGRPLKTSVFAAGLMAALLTTGLISLLLELPNWWEKIFDTDNQNAACNKLIAWAVILVIWAIWSLLFFIYWKQGDRYTQLGKMIRGLVAGSILETIIGVPVHIWATQQRECYCCRGTYTTLVLSATVLIWAFGPGIILLYMREKLRIKKLNP